MSFEFPDEFKLYVDPKLWNDFTDDLTGDAESYVSQHNEIHRRIGEESMYIKFIDGDRKGSIAKVRFDRDGFRPEAFDPCKIVRSRSDKWRLQNEYFYVVAYWEKRKNKVKLTLPHRQVVFLPNYTGPTVYELFDRKAAKEEALREPDQHDIDGNLLSVGDKVLYINARYGSAMELCHGTIKEFLANVNSKSKEITTVVRMDGDKEILSNVSYPSTMIWKKT